MKDTIMETIQALTTETWTQSWRHRAMALTFVALAAYCGVIQEVLKGRSRLIETGLISAGLWVSTLIEWVLGLRASEDEYGQ